MRKATLAALEASIEHWRQNKNVESLNEASIAGDDCALCGRFAIAENAVGCDRYSADRKRVIEKCPVGSGCVGTPYWAAYRAIGERDLTAFKKHAARMWRHLKSLRPDDGANERAE